MAVHTQHTIDIHDIPVYYKQIVLYCCWVCCYILIIDSNVIPFCCIVSNFVEPYRILISIQIKVDMEHNSTFVFTSKSDDFDKDYNYLETEKRVHMSTLELPKFIYQNDHIQKWNQNNKIISIPMKSIRPIIWIVRLISKRPVDLWW